MATSALIDSIVKGAQVGALGAKSYEARKKRQTDEDIRANSLAYAGASGALEAAQLDAAQPRGALPPRDDTAPAAPTAPAPVAPAAAIPPAAAQAQAPAPAADPTDTAAVENLVKGIAKSPKAVSSKTGGKHVTAKQLFALQREVMKAAAKVSPEAVADSSKKFLDGLHANFLRYGNQAMAYQQSGMMDKAAESLNIAGNYLANGYTTNWTVSPDGQSLIGKIEDETPDSGEPLPPLVVFPNKGKDGGPPALVKFMGMMKDPAGFRKMMMDEQDTLAKQKIAERGATNAERGTAIDAQGEARLGRSDARAAQSHSVALEIANENLRRAKAEADPNTPEGQAYIAGMEQKVAAAETAVSNASLADTRASDAATLSMAGVPLRQAEASIASSTAGIESRKKAASAALLRAQALVDKNKGGVAGLTSDQLLNNIARLTGRLGDVNVMIADGLFEDRPDELAAAKATRLALTGILNDLERHRVSGAIPTSGAGGAAATAATRPGGVPPDSKQANDGKWFAPNGMVFDSTGRHIGDVSK